jgi:ABC-type uncharacterized transport system substrate-binding protein
MLSRIIRRCAGGLALLAGIGLAEASAHPHVWVTVKSELVYAPDGTLTAVRHHWTFDEMFSTFATQGMDDKKPGGLTREDLAPLAEVNVSSLKEFDYFTYALADGKKSALKDAQDYWLDQKDGALTLHFTLPLVSPVKAKQLDMQVYDNSYFVDFSLATRDAAALVNAPAQCKLASVSSRGGAQQQASTEAFVQAPDANNYGAQFANKILVTCQ